MRIETYKIASLIFHTGAYSHILCEFIGQSPEFAGGMVRRSPLNVPILVMADADVIWDGEELDVPEDKRHVLFHKFSECDHDLIRVTVTRDPHMYDKVVRVEFLPGQE